MNDKKQIEEIAKDLELANEVRPFANNGLHEFPTDEQVASCLYDLGYRKIPKNAVVIPEKITEQTSPSDLIKIAKYNESVRKETAKEIFNDVFSLINNAKDKSSKIFGNSSEYGKGYKNSVSHFNEHILELAKRYAVDLGE